MTIAPDPAEITPPRDPATYARRRGPGLWLVAAACLVSVAAGIGIAFWGKDRLPALRAPEPAAVRPAPLSPPTRLLPVPQQDAFAPAPGQDLGALEGRVRTLETAQARTMNAAAAALASALLAEAAESSRPFAAELSALDRVLPMSPDALALRQFAEAGAPTRAALAAGFDDAAARAAVAARDPGERAGPLARLTHMLSAIVTIRRVGSTTGDGADAVLARAERQVGDGDIDGALHTLAELPEPAQQAMAGWRAGAERRAEIDRRVAAIRASALADLAQVARAQP